MTRSWREQKRSDDANKLLSVAKFLCGDKRAFTITFDNEDWISAAQAELIDEGVIEIINTEVDASGKQYAWARLTRAAYY